jgi:regulator of protease activity HflC (stomatin/prohibitin superfamily)
VDKAFGWLGEIFQTLLRVIPWLVIVPATHRGVAFVRGFKVKEWAPGLHWYWPVVTTYKLLIVVRQTVRIQSKVIMTRDLKTVTVGSLVTYHINDVIAAGVHIADLPSDVLNGYGVEVHQAQLTEFAPCSAIAINGHAAIGNYSLWTGF